MKKEYLVQFHYYQRAISTGQVVICANSEEEARRIAYEKDYNCEFDGLIDAPEIIESDFVIEDITALSDDKETK